MKKTQLLLLLPAFLATIAISSCCCPARYRPPMNAGCKSGDHSINGACPDPPAPHQQK